MAVPTVKTKVLQRGVNKVTMLVMVTKKNGDNTDFSVTHDLGIVPTWATFEEVQAVGDGTFAMLGVPHGVSATVSAAPLSTIGVIAADAEVIAIHIDDVDSETDVSGLYILTVGRHHSVEK